MSVKDNGQNISNEKRKIQLDENYRAATREIESVLYDNNNNDKLTSFLL